MFGTGGTHRPRVFEEAQAALFEWQFAVVQQAPNFRFGVIYQLFIDNAMHAAREHRIEVGHQGHVVVVVPANIREAIAEALAPRIELLEVRQAATERMAPGVDDLRVRQDAVNKPHVQKVVGHLVDEQLPAGLAIDARALQVVFA